MARRLDFALDRDRIVDAAFELLDDEGLDGLSMRKLATRLSVQAPAFYWHVADKAELLGLMAASLHMRARTGVTGAADWRDWLVRFGRSLKATLQAHRDGGLICATAKPVGAQAEAVAHEIAAPLVAFGLSEDDALAFQASVISLTLGWVLFEENGPMHAFLADMMDLERSYEAGLAALVRGYRREGG